MKIAMRLLPFAIFFFSFIGLQAQEQVGLRPDNYAGINSIGLNPAWHMTTPFSWDLNLVEGAQYFSTNYAFVENSSLLDLYKNQSGLDILFRPNLDAEKPIGENQRVVDFFEGTRKRFAYQLASVMGPALMIRFHPQHSFGLYYKARLLGGTQNIPAPLSYYIYNDIPLQEEIRLQPFSASGMAWSEIGINYLYQFETSTGSAGFGITAKWLQGYEGTYWNNRQEFVLTKLQENRLSGSPLDFAFGYTTSNLNGEDFQLSRNGSGIGLDLGFVYTAGAYDDGYSMKLGVSLLDLGKVTFRTAAAEHLVRTDTTSFIDIDDYKDFDSPEEVEEKIRLFSQNVLNDPNASLNSEQLTIWLPTALSLQMDYSFTPSFFVFASLTQGIPLSRSALNRGSLLAVAPRLENRWYGASLPVTFYNWKELQMGMALRLAFLTVGTDRLGSIFRKSDLNGADLYFAIKVSPFSLGKGNSGSKARVGGNKTGKSKDRCYEF